VELHKDWFPPEEIIGAALTRVEKLLRGREVLTNIAAQLPLIRVDGVLIEEVLMNVLENAAKHTALGTPIEISAAESGDRVVVSVRDHGLGFAPGDEQRVFEKFVRGKSAGMHGAGLGLAICRAVMQRHGGSITAANRPGGGAVITIEVPVGGTPPVVADMPEISTR
jgi:two-component system sensor histidine kinase KdpD